jgi:undecaprenyl pyrophosphate phosphatase UppP
LDRDRKKTIRASQKGVGLYTYQQEKNTTPFQYLTQIVVGTIFALMGGLILFHQITANAWHVWGWVGGLAVIVMGVFMAHAGVIFYYRQMRGRVFGRAHKSRK